MMTYDLINLLGAISAIIFLLAALAPTKVIGAALGAIWADMEAAFWRGYRDRKNSLRDGDRK